MRDDLGLRRRLCWGGLAGGVLFTAVMTVGGSLITSDPWPQLLPFAIPTGVVFGWVLPHRLEPVLREQLTAVAGADRTSLRAAAQALRRGQIPEDPQQRALAADLARGRLGLLVGRRGRTCRFFTVAVQVVATGAQVVMALVWTPWWWAAVACLAVPWVVSSWQISCVHRYLVRAEVAQARWKDGEL